MAPTPGSNRIGQKKPSTVHREKMLPAREGREIFGSTINGNKRKTSLGPAGGKERGDSVIAATDPKSRTREGGREFDITYGFSYVSCSCRLSAFSPPILLFYSPPLPSPLI